MEEVEILRERQNVSAQLYFSSHEVLVESDNYRRCDILKNKNKDFQNTLERFTKRRDNSNPLREN